MVSVHATSLLALVAFVATADSVYARSLASVQTLPNWVGPKVGAAEDTACYRKTHLTNKCPPGFEFDNLATCWAECPIEYPVECGMECIPQNEDCALEVISKVNAVATVALNVATSGVFGQLRKASKAVQTGVKCGQQLFVTTNKIVDYANELQESYPSSTKTQILSLLSASDVAVYDLPVAIMTCLGLSPPKGLEHTAVVVAMGRKILEHALNKGDAMLDLSTFLNVTAEVGLAKSIGELSTNGFTTLKNLIGSGVTCGSELTSITNRVVAEVKKIKATTPSSSVNSIRLELSNSELFLKDIPAVTSSCVLKNSKGDFATRDNIRKTFQVIIDQIIDSSSANDKPLSTADFALKATDMGLDAVALFDPTGIADLAKEFIQPICGPTSILGEMDDGPADQALGLRTVGRAFEGTSGTWKKSGNGVLSLIFESRDNVDVVVNVFSGGNKIADVLVKRGTTVTWTKLIKDVKDKTMYLDRWRPGFFGIMGTGGGSLLIWIPHSSKGGSLQLRVKINES